MTCAVSITPTRHGAVTPLAPPKHAAAGVFIAGLHFYSRTGTVSVSTLGSLAGSAAHTVVIPTVSVARAQAPLAPCCPRAILKLVRVWCTGCFPLMADADATLVPRRTEGRPVGINRSVDNAETGSGATLCLYVVFGTLGVLADSSPSSCSVSAAGITWCPRCPNAVDATSGYRSADEAIIAGALTSFTTFRVGDVEILRVVGAVVVARALFFLHAVPIFVLPVTRRALALYDTVF